MVWDASAIPEPILRMTSVAFLPAWFSQTANLRLNIVITHTPSGQGWAWWAPPCSSSGIEGVGYLWTKSRRTGGASTLVFEMALCEGTWVEGIRCELMPAGVLRWGLRGSFCWSSFGLWEGVFGFVDSPQSGIMSPDAGFLNLALQSMCLQYYRLTTMHTHNFSQQRQHHLIILLKNWLFKNM